jgi:hypothetical protein
MLNASKTILFPDLSPKDEKQSISGRNNQKIILHKEKK